VKLLTKNSDYAVRALLVLARNRERYVSAREIARLQNIPYQFLRRILQELIRTKLVVSREGSGGGFKIKVDPGAISLVDIIKIFQGEIQLNDCMFRKNICAKRSGCALRLVIKRVEKIIERQFEGVVLASLAEK